MQALSAASSYFLLDGEAWRISQDVELRHGQPYGIALGFIANFGAEHVLWGTIIDMIWIPSRWTHTEDNRRLRQKKNLKRNASRRLGIDI